MELILWEEVDIEMFVDNLFYIDVILIDGVYL